MRIVWLVFACLCVSACKQGKVYDRTLDETRAMLKNTEVPLHYFGASSSVDYSMSQPSEDTIVWKVSSQGAPMLTYTAKMTSEGVHSTRVALTMTGETSPKFGDVEKRMDGLPAIRNLYVATMTEAIDSDLEARPFDTVNFYPQLAAAAMSTATMLKAPRDADDDPRSR